MGVFGARFYEEPRYEVLARIDHRIEIRRYAPRLAAQIELPQADHRGRDEAFRTLFAYIAGANSASGSVNARIAMTVPVAVEQLYVVRTFRTFGWQFKRVSGSSGLVQAAIAC